MKTDIVLSTDLHMITLAVEHLHDNNISKVGGAASFSLQKMCVYIDNIMRMASGLTGGVLAPTVLVFMNMFIDSVVHELIHLCNPTWSEDEVIRASSAATVYIIPDFVLNLFLGD